MALETREILYEILIRLERNAQGVVVPAAHQIKMVEVYDPETGVIQSRQLGDATELNPQDVNSLVDAEVVPAFQQQVALLQSNMAEVQQAAARALLDKQTELENTIAQKDEERNSKIAELNQQQVEKINEAIEQVQAQHVETLTQKELEHAQDKASALAARDAQHDEVVQGLNTQLAELTTTLENLQHPPLVGPDGRRLIPKSLIQERVNAIGKLDEAFAILQAQPIFFGRWFAPDWPNVYFDDPGLLQILAAAGCTPEEIAQITAPV